MAIATVILYTSLVKHLFATEFILLMHICLYLLIVSISLFSTSNCLSLKIIMAIFLSRAIIFLILEYYFKFYNYTFY